jgi:hypothetical protein
MPGWCGHIEKPADLVKIIDVWGGQNWVRQHDLDHRAVLIPLYTRAGVKLSDTAAFRRNRGMCTSIHRENIVFEVQRRGFR